MNDFFPAISLLLSLVCGRMGDTMFNGAVTPLNTRGSTRSTRKSKTKFNKPKKLIDELQGRTPSKKTSDGISESFKDDVKESPTFFNYFKTENRDKNLKLDGVFLYDATRVVLTEGSDYYHASFVDGCSRPNQYILAQAPMKNTLEDFLRLVQQQKPEAIVFMDKADSEEGKILLKDAKEENKSAGFDTYSLAKHKTKVFCINGWTSDGQLPKDLLDTHDKIRKAVPFDVKTPVLFVCKDGAARCGVFALLDQETERVKSRQRIKLVEAVKILRMQRSNVFDAYEVFDAALGLIMDMAKKQ